MSPTGKYTAVFSPNGNSVAIVDNATETIADPHRKHLAVAAHSACQALPRASWSSNFATAAYAAVPTAPIAGQAPGAVVCNELADRVHIRNHPVPGAHFIVPSPDGNHISGVQR